MVACATLGVGCQAVRWFRAFVRFVAFWCWGAPLSLGPGFEKKRKKRKRVGGQTAPTGPTQTQTKPPRKRYQPGPTPHNETTAKTRLDPGQPGPLFLLDRFSTILPGLPRPLSYRIGGYPIGYTNRADCRCERNAIPSPILQFTPTTSDVIAGMGVTQFLALQSSL